MTKTLMGSIKERVADVLVLSHVTWCQRHTKYILIHVCDGCVGIW